LLSQSSNQAWVAIALERQVPEAFGQSCGALRSFGSYHWRRTRRFDEGDGAPAYMSANTLLLELHRL
jgi:hypothetical protein